MYYGETRRVFCVSRSSNRLTFRLPKVIPAAAGASSKQLYQRANFHNPQLDQIGSRRKSSLRLFTPYVHHFVPALLLQPCTSCASSERQRADWKHASIKVVDRSMVRLGVSFGKYGTRKADYRSIFSSFFNKSFFENFSKSFLQIFNTFLVWVRSSAGESRIVGPEKECLTHTWHPTVAAVLASVRSSTTLL